MKRTNRCPKCSSTDVITDAKAIDPTNQSPISVATYRNLKALVFKGQASTSLSAWVCTECGYVELYADDPAKIKVART